MLKTLRMFDRRLVPLLGLLLTLVFALPAFEAHACAVELSAPVASASLDVADDAAPECPDCGPACANGCCHAAHAAIANDAPVTKAAGPVRAVETWADAAEAPLSRPAGPERPPRT